MLQPPNVLCMRERRVKRAAPVVALLAVELLVEPVFGVLGDSRWRRVVVLGGGVAMGAALALLAGATTFFALLIAFAALYPATGAFVSLSQATLMDREPARREVNMTR